MSTAVGKRHDWAAIPAAPYTDGMQCVRCGLVASSTQKASERMMAFLPSCEAKP